jgi:hypothetical protein
MKISSFLVVLFASARLLGCAEEESGTTVSGSVQLSRTTGSETGQTGFVFPDTTMLEMNPFYGSCTIEDTADGTIVSVSIERVQPDEFGLSSFTFEAPVETPVAPGSAKVTAVAGGTTFSDANGSCEVGWGRFDRSIGRFDVYVDCAAMSGGAAAETVTFNADLLLSGCN